MATAVVMLPLAWSVARSLLQRDVGVDAIALIAIATAVALGQYLAGPVVTLMLAGRSAQRRRPLRSGSRFGLAPPET